MNIRIYLLLGMALEHNHSFESVANKGGKETGSPKPKAPLVNPNMVPTLGFVRVIQGAAR